MAVKINGDFEIFSNNTNYGSLKEIANKADSMGAAATKGVKTLSAVGDAGWSNQTDGDANLISKAFMAWWNGKYNSSNSNLMYAHQGEIQCKPTNLYNNATGTNGTVTLSQTSANFTYLEIFYRDYDNHYNSVKVYSPNGKIFWMDGGWVNDSNTSGNMKVAYSTISGTSITKTRYLEGSIGASGTSNHNYIYIVRVDGYK